MAAPKVSKQVELPATCLVCGAEWNAKLWNIIDAVEEPEAWAKCLDGSINTVVCPNGDDLLYHVPLLLIDPRSKRNVYVPSWDPPVELDATTRVQLVNSVLELDPQRAEYMRTSKIVSRKNLTAALQSFQVEESRPVDEPVAVQRSPELEAALRDLAGDRLSPNEKIGVANQVIEKAPDDAEACGIAAEAAGAASEALAEINRDATYLSDAENAYHSAALSYSRAGLYSRYAIVGLKFSVLAGRKVKRLDADFDTSDESFDTLQDYYVAMRDPADIERVLAERARYSLAAVRQELSADDPDFEKCLQVCRRILHETTGGNIGGLYRALMTALGDVLFHASSGGSKIERLAQAVETYRNAQGAKDFIEDLPQWVILQERISHAYIEMARYRQPTFQEAISEGFRAVNASLPAMGNVHTRALFLVGLAYSGWPGARETDLAIDFLERAKEALQTKSDAILRYDITMNLAGVYARRSKEENRGEGDDRRAYDLANEILKFVDITVRPKGESPSAKLQRALANAGSADKLGSDLEEALAIAIAQNDEIPLLERRGFNAWLAEELVKRGRHEQAMDAYDRALRAGDLLVRQAATPVQRRYRQDDNEKIDVEVVGAALTQATVRQTFLYAERAKARWHQQSVALLPYPAPAAVPEELQEEERRLLRAVRELEEAFGRPDGTAFEEMLVARYEQLLDALDDLWSRFDEEYAAHDYVAARRSSILTWDSVEKWFASNARTGFLSYFVLQDQIVSFFVRSGDHEPTITKVGISKDELADAVSRFSDEVGAAGSAEETWATLAEPLVADLEHRIDGLDLLYVSKHGPIHALPIHAIALGSQPLMARVPVAYIDGFGMLLQTEMRQRALADANEGAVVVGDPRGDLPEAALEAAEVAATLGVPPLVGGAATVESVRQAIYGGRPSTVHFATHTVFDRNDPRSSGVVLADGTLRAGQMESHSLSARLVVVSGCSSGVSGTTSGDEQWGMLRALSLAGAATMIVALWDVEDASTRMIMNDFYRIVSEAPARKRNVVRSLAQAMLSQRKVRPETRYWAAFAVYGIA